MAKHGENIRKRKDGRWEARVIRGYNQNQKAIYQSIYGKTYQEVKAKKLTYLRNPDQNNTTENIESDEKVLIKRVLTTYPHASPQDITVRQLMYEWLNGQRIHIKDSTYYCYLNLIEHHILPRLGNKTIDQLTNLQLESFLKEKLINGRLDGKGGLSPKTVCDIRAILVLLLKYAIQHGYPCQATTDLYSPKQKMTPTEVITHQEQWRLEQIIYHSKDPLMLGILLALYGGLRIGEVCALQWKHISFTEGVLHVEKTLYRIRADDADASNKTKVIAEAPKTISSIRTIPLPDFVLEHLKQFQRASHIYVITGTQRFIEPRTMLARYKKVLEEAQIQEYTFHALRHTFATRCIENSFDVKSLSEILGHANIQTTLQRYVHPTMTHKKQQMQRLEEESFWGQK